MLEGTRHTVLPFSQVRKQWPIARATTIRSGEADISSGSSNRLEVDSPGTLRNDAEGTFASGEQSEEVGQMDTLGLAHALDTREDSSNHSGQEESHSRMWVLPSLEWQRGDMK